MSLLLLRLLLLLLLRLLELEAEADRPVVFFPPRALLPREDPLEDEELDPRFELVQMLLESRPFTAASADCRSLAVKP